MHDDLKHFNELLFIDKMRIEAKLFDGPEDGQFLIDLQFVVDVFEHL